MAKREKKIRIAAPDIADNCQHCGRKLDDRMIGNPFGQWSVPTFAKGNTYCGYCAEKALNGWDARKELKACPALEQLNLWLAQPSPFPEGSR